MQISTFPPVAEVKGRLLGRTDPEAAAAALNDLRSKGVDALTRAQLSYAAGIVGGLHTNDRCLACGGPLASLGDRRRGVDESCWDGGYRPTPWPELADVDQRRMDLT